MQIPWGKLPENAMCIYIPLEDWPTPRMLQEEIGVKVRVHKLEKLLKAIKLIKKVE